MRTITYIDKNYGVWPSNSKPRGMLDFKLINREADAISKNIGGKVLIIMKKNGIENDITEWARKMNK